MFSLLVGHGSRDPRYQAVLNWCVQHSQMALAPMAVRGAVLENHPLPLSEQIVEQVHHLGDPELKLIPLFMGGGIHLHTDIPEQVARAQQRYPQIRVQITPPLGSQRGLVTLLAQRLRSTAESTPWIVVAHGSRRPSFAQDIRHVIHQVCCHQPGLRIQPAFLTQSPTLLEQMHFLYERGHREVGIQPFLLFPGGLLEAIQAQIHQCPHLTVKWGSPFAPDPAVIAMISNLAQGGA